MNGNHHCKQTRVGRPLESLLSVPAGNSVCKTPMRLVKVHALMQRYDLWSRL